MASTLSRFTSLGRAVFAHRGGAALAPENTFAAFDNALALGADGLELDVRLSSDDVVVVHHDAQLDRTTNAAGYVGARTAHELAGVDAGFRFGPTEGYPARGKGIGVPRLRDVLSRYRDVPIIIEMKGNSTALARATVDDVRAAGAIDRVCLGGFETRTLRAARSCECAIVTGASREETRWALYRSWIGWTKRSVPYQMLQVPEFADRTQLVSPRLIRAAHEAGLLVQIWTVNDADDIRRLLDWGADGVITDRPDVAVPVVKEWAARRQLSKSGSLG